MKQKWTKNEFINASMLIHGNRYDYSKSQYINYHTKLEIVCKIHGSFWQIPYNHILGRGCKRCNCGTVFDTKDFVNKAKQIHLNLYDYSKSIYKKNRIPIEIICKQHGTFFQLPNTHLRGSGCVKCGIETTKLKTKNTTNYFIKQAKKIHLNLYDYSKANYIQTHKKVKIICKIHGEFLQTPHNHITNKQGCPDCVHTVSKGEKDFLDFVEIPKDRKHRQKYIGKFKVDGIKHDTNTIYEFLGNYYHGNPSIYCRNSFNPTCNKTFGKLYDETFERLNKLKTCGYSVSYIWESDWHKFKNKISTIPNIINL